MITSYENWMLKADAEEKYCPFSLNNSVTHLCSTDKCMAWAERNDGVSGRCDLINSRDEVET